MKALQLRWRMGRWMLVLAALGLGAAGCQRFSLTGEKKNEPPKPPDYVKVIGTGSANLAQVATTSSLGFAGLLRGPIKAESSAPLDARINDPAQRVLMAQAEARRKALRTLGGVIMAQRGQQGATLGEMLRKSPTDQSKLNTLLEQKAQVTFANEAQGVHASAMIDGRQVMDALGLAAQQSAALKTGGSLEEKKAIAYNLAFENAKKKLEQALLEIRLPDGHSVREALEANSDVALDFNAMLWVVQPDETHYMPDGSCEVTIFFDRNRVPEILKGKRKWWARLLPSSAAKTK